MEDELLARPEKFRKAFWDMFGGEETVKFLTGAENTEVDAHADTATDKRYFCYHFQLYLVFKGWSLRFEVLTPKDEALKYAFTGRGSDIFSIARIVKSVGGVDSHEHVGFTSLEKDTIRREVLSTFGLDLCPLEPLT